MMFRGERLRVLRTDRDMSQSKLAGNIGAHVTSISDWERGDNSPSPRHVASLARELGVQIEHFYGDGEDDEEAAQQMNADLLNAVRALKRVLDMVDAA